MSGATEPIPARFMVSAAALTISQVFSPPFRAVLWKSIGLTIALLIAVWFGLQALLGIFVVLPFGWLETAFGWLTGIGLVVGLGFLVAPVTSLFAGLFLDDIAAEVEATNYPADPPGRPLPLAESLWTTIGFTGVVIIVNIVALILILLPGINIVIFFVANGYLLGREYFELAARRFGSAEDVRRMRRRHGGSVFLAGLMIAGVLAIPILNLLTPLFATALMVHVHKRLSGSRPAASAMAG